MTTASVLIQAAYREGNLLPVGTTPTAAELLEALASLNRIIFTMLLANRSAPLYDYMVSAITSALEKHTRIVMGGTEATLSFPPSPDDGSLIALTQGNPPGGLPGTASGVMTPSLSPTNGNTVTIGVGVYTWVSAFTAPDQVLNQPNVGAALTNLALAVNGSEGAGVYYSTGTDPSSQVSASADYATGMLTVTALLPGAYGNTFATSTNDPGGGWGASTLTGGGSGGALLTLDGNGRTIGGAPEQQYYAPVPDIQWMYRADLGDWTQILPNMGINDNCPFPEDFDDMFGALLLLRLAPRYGKEVSSQTQLVVTEGLTAFSARYFQGARLNVAMTNLEQQATK